MEAFILLEKYNAIKLLQNVHQQLASLGKVLKGSELLTKDVADLAEALMNQEVTTNNKIFLNSMFVMEQCICCMLLCLCRI